ncbi:MAG: GGDEF domain-containing protein [Acidobacteria bacterium]|nr:GGDEF domain-containing protein [Acidobacteriota bacterium]
MNDQVRVDSSAGHPTRRVATEPPPAEPSRVGRLGLPCGDDDAALCRERTSSSLARLRLLLPVLAVVHLGTAVVFTAARVPEAAADPAMLEAWHDGLRWASGTMSVVAGLLTMLVWIGAPRRGEPRSWARSLPLASAFAYVLFAAWVTGIDQQVSSGLTAFMVAVFAVALFARLPVAASSAVYGTAWLALWVALVCFQPSPAVRLSNIVNGTTLAALGWGLSLVLDRGFVRDFVNRRTIEAQRHDLQLANERLGDSLAALQRANGELVQEVRVRTIAERELARLATNDPLTDVANRRRFLEIAELERQRAQTVGGRAAVAMLDVDHFKAINDRHGHAVGDEVLRAVAARCSAAMRTGDAVGRLGGDEFALLLVGATLADAVGVAERISTAVREWELTTREGPVNPSVSIGVAEVPAAGSDGIRVALDCADHALYEAKRSGRGRVAVRTVPPPRSLN